VSTVVLNVRVLEPGPRAEQLLAAAAAQVKGRLSLDLAPELAQFWFTGLSAARARSEIQAALDAAGDDWSEHLRLPPAHSS
jgi:hypothetical protein